MKTHAWRIGRRLLQLVGVVASTAVLNFALLKA